MLFFLMSGILRGDSYGQSKPNIYHSKMFSNPRVHRDSLSLGGIHSRETSLLLASSSNASSRKALKGASGYPNPPLVSASITSREIVCRQWMNFLKRFQFKFKIKSDCSLFDSGGILYLNLNFSMISVTSDENSSSEVSSKLCSVSC